MQAEAGERIEDDGRERREIVDDEGEGADIEDFLDERAEHIAFAVHRPEQARNGHVDGNQDGTECGDIAIQKPESAVDIADEGLHELVDDIQIVHRERPVLLRRVGVVRSHEALERGAAFLFGFGVARLFERVGAILRGHQVLDLKLLLGR